MIESVSKQRMTDCDFVAISFAAVSFAAVSFAVASFSELSTQRNQHGIINPA